MKQKKEDYKILVVCPDKMSYDKWCREHRFLAPFSKVQYLNDDTSGLNGLTFKEIFIDEYIPVEPEFVKIYKKDIRSNYKLKINPKKIYKDDSPYPVEG